MGALRTFRDLVAWQRGMALAKLMYRETQGMPSEERFELTRQIRRAAVSIPSNIAEGYGRESKADYIRFLKPARGSLYELSTQVELATSLEMFSPSTQLIQLIEETDRVLQGLIRSLQRQAH